MRRFVLLASLWLVVGCGDGSETPVDVDAAPGIDVPVEDAVKDVTDEICAPACEGKECGDNGCGGQCGTCPAGSGCDLNGLCVGAPCESDADCGDQICHPGLGECAECLVHDDCGQGGFCLLGACAEPEACATTLDCSGELVCDLDAGVCVACAGSEDCADGNFCGGDGLCYQLHPCASDKDCKDFNMVCDKSKGRCADCLDSDDCPEYEHCSKSACVTDTCYDGDAYCTMGQVMSCGDQGAQWSIVETCESNEYCEDAACHEMTCMPDSRWCEEMVLRVCDEIGKELAEETDCDALGLFCMDGECVDVACIPDSITCDDDFSLSLCAADGLSATVEACPDAHYCLDGECLPWVCVPDFKQCQGLVAYQCNEKGSVEVEVDCEGSGKGCKDGECEAYACVANTNFCINSATVGQCSADGFSYDSAECPDAHFCSEGVCEPWACNPGETLCLGSVATTCADDGSGVANEVDCAQTVGFCFEGTCVDCIPSCVGKICGDDGCGGSCGTCNGSQEACVNGTCVCQPDCNGKQCGPDGCGGSCGNCLGPQDACIDGLCACQPDCDGLTCGPNGCGGSCGACAAGQYCIDGVCPPAGKTCDDGNDEPWDGCYNNDVAEFILYPMGKDEAGVTLSPIDSGGHVAAWLSDVDNTSQVHVQRYYGDGTAATDVALAHASGTGQDAPAVAALSNGRIAVAWDGYGIDGASRGVQARILNADLSPKCAPFTVNTATTGDQDSVALVALQEGRFGVAWESGGDQDGSSTGVFVRVYDSDCVPQSAEKQVNTFTYAAQYGPSVAPAGTGFVVVWNSVLQDGASGGIFGQRFGADWAKAGDEFPVNVTTANNQRDPVVGGWDSGFLAAWESNNQDGSNWGVYGRAFAQNGVPKTVDTLINTTTAGEQSHAGISCNGDGDCVVVWRHQTAGGFEVHYRLLDAAGSVVGQPVLANVANCTVIESPQVALLSDGGLVLAWLGNGYGIQPRMVVRRFSADGTPLYH